MGEKDALCALFSFRLSPCFVRAVPMTTQNKEGGTVHVVQDQYHTR